MNIARQIRFWEWSKKMAALWYTLFAVAVIGRYVSMIMLFTYGTKIGNKGLVAVGFVCLGTSLLLGLITLFVIFGAEQRHHVRQPLD